MVKYKIKDKNKDQIWYEYFPEGDFSKNSGIIVVNLKTKSAYIKKLAENDFEYSEDIKNCDFSMTSYIKENTVWYFYASHIICKLYECITIGDLPSEGTIFWY